MLITLDELARAASIGVFGGLAGVCTLAFPGSPVWLGPAALAVGGCALTVPELRQEAARALPLLAEARPLLQAPANAARGVGEWVRTGQRAPRPAAPPQRAPQARQEAPEALPPGAWLRVVNDRPDDNPHMIVVGPSGTGKTTFVSAALGRRPGRVVVLTPKVSPAAWRGAEVVTLDDELSYEPIAAALDALQTEAKRRAKALQRGEPLGEPLTVVLDELPELHAEVKGLGKFAVRLSRWGRELQMRQVVIATKDEALNIPGWEATRDNYVRVELEKPADDGRRLAWLDDGRARRPLDLASVKAGADQAQLQPWRGEAAPRPATAAPANRSQVAAPVDAPFDLSDFLNDLLAQPVTSASGRQDTPATVTAPVTETTVTDTDTDTPAGVSHTRVTIGEGPGGPAIYVYAQASAPAAPQPASGAPAALRRRKGLDVRRRRQRATQGHSPALDALQAEQRQAEARKAELRAAYEQRKAAGLSYRKAYEELGGGSTETRAWWAAAPGPQK